jgi:uroporphyrinogen III methyltransferase/synthase
MGTVYLVGAGPGDAGLLTLRGAELLRRADVVLHDALVNPDLLRLAPPSAEIIARGKNMSMPQEEIAALLIARAREGKCVVRLKGGDPYIFGRGGEEAEALAAAKIHFEVVPGISSIVAAPNYAGIPLTHREHCSSFTVFTGHENPADAKTDLRYDQIAKIPGTKVAGRAKAKKMSPPVLTIIGDVVKLRGKLNWFEQRPLFGRRVVVTRRSEQAGGFAQRLTELGADVLEVPTIKITQPKETDAIVDALLGLNSYDWLVFTSVNGVTAFFDIFFRRFQDLRDIGGVRIAAVGPATAAKLRELHLQVDLTPDEFVGKKIAAAFAKFQTIENLKICLLRAEVADPDLPRALEELGAIVDDIAIYKTVAETEDPAGAGATLLESGADWVTFTSGSTVEHFHTRFDLPKLLKKFPQTKLASIGPETSKAIRTLGLEPALEAKAHTTDGLIAALLKAI